MTVKELKQELEKYPDAMDVFLAERETDFKFGLLNSVGSQQIGFKENPDDEEPMATDTVLILGEQF